MSEHAAGTVEPTTATTPEVPQGDPAEALGDGGKKALAAEREARKAAEKSASEALARLKQIETAQLSDLERAQREASEAKDALADLTKRALRDRVALTKGVPADLADFLSGDTEDELAAKADVLLARLAKAPTGPIPDPSQGSHGEPLALNGDPLLTDLKHKLGIA